MDCPKFSSDAHFPSVLHIYFMICQNYVACNLQQLRYNGITSLSGVGVSNVYLTRSR